MNGEEKIRRSLKLPNVSQIGFVVRDLDETVRYYKDILGLGPFVEPELEIRDKEYYGKAITSTWRMSFCSLGPVELEIIEPITGPTIYHDFLRDRGEGMHHLGFDVPDIDVILNQCRQMGIEIMQKGRIEQGGFAYLNTERIGGVIFEIIQRKSRRI